MKDGDLRKHFQETVVSKGPWAIWLSTVKGHATTEQVAAGEVEKEDKEGNDMADEAADKGSKELQRWLASMAKTAGRPLFNSAIRKTAGWIHPVHLESCFWL